MARKLLKELAGERQGQGALMSESGFRSRRVSGVQGQRLSCEVLRRRVAATNNVMRDNSKSRILSS